jgi:hypothetical protein
MQVTFQNASADEIYVSALYKQLAAGGSVTASRTPTQLDDQGLKALLEAGTLTITATVLEDGDAIQIPTLDKKLYEFLPSESDATRGSATLVPVGTLIYNTSDNAPNVSDGTNWRDMAGVIT